MQLTELEPKWLRYETKVEVWTRRKDDGTDEEVTGPRIYMPIVDDISQAQGVEFLCPKCFTENNGPVGTHAVICWSRSRGITDDVTPGPGRWMLVGTGFEDLTLNADPPNSARSVLLTSGCGWHGFVTNGEVA